jgi:hypothetical protein
MLPMTIGFPSPGTEGAAGVGAPGVGASAFEPAAEPPAADPPFALPGAVAALAPVEFPPEDAPPAAVALAPAVDPGRPAAPEPDAAGAGEAAASADGVVADDVSSDADPAFALVAADPSEDEVAAWLVPLALPVSVAATGPNPADARSALSLSRLPQPDVISTANPSSAVPTR